jgi:hypothetical protein
MTIVIRHCGIRARISRIAGAAHPEISPGEFAVI